MQLVNGTAFCFYTYTVKSTGGSETKICLDAPVVMNVKYFFYQGYSRELQRVFSYLRVNEVNYSLITKNTLHMDPNAFYATIGSYTMILKQIKASYSIKMEFGPSAYRETLI